MTDIIKIENLIFKYPPNENGEEKIAINDISLSIAEGSFTAIIGRNGSGKSTLAKCINALLVAGEGDVFVDGMNTKDESKIWDIRQTAAMVFQNPDNQIVAAIVEDDVAFGPENLGVEPRTIRQRVDESLESVKMWDYRKKGPHQLSGGQKQRIAVAGAIAMKPKCIIFDEPTAMLDPRGRKELVDIIKKQNQEGMTCILITHFMEEAAEADRVIIMDKGQIVMDAPPSEIFCKRDELKNLDLDVPMAVELGHRLEAAGIDVPKGIMREKELVDWICQLK